MTIHKLRNAKMEIFKAPFSPTATTFERFKMLFFYINQAVSTRQASFVNLPRPPPFAVRNLLTAPWNTYLCTIRDVLQLHITIYQSFSVHVSWKFTFNLSEYKEQISHNICNLKYCVRFISPLYFNVFIGLNSLSGNLFN